MDYIASLFFDFMDPKTYFVFLFAGLALWALPIKMPRLAKYAVKMAFGALLAAMILSSNITLLLAKKNAIPGYEIKMDVKPTSEATR